MCRVCVPDDALKPESNYNIAGCWGACYGRALSWQRTFCSACSYCEQVLKRPWTVETKPIAWRCFALMQHTTAVSAGSFRARYFTNLGVTYTEHRAVPLCPGMNRM